MEDIGVNLSPDRVLVHPGALANVLFNDPTFDVDRFKLGDYPNKLEMEQLARQATRVLLRQGVKGTNLPINLAFLRRCLAILDEEYVAQTDAPNVTTQSTGDASSTQPSTPHKTFKFKAMEMDNRSH
ncbi:unnamed protein product [Dicrocoelium dendriticum]|nr:unnamed protein product [Dicrocoelium dendriticum]